MPSVIVSPEGTSYSQEAVLGSGAFGTILKCKHGDRFESDCVVKRVKLARQTPQERFASVQELAVLQQLRHRNLVRGIDGWIEAKHTACLVMDYCDGGDLASLLHARKGQALLEDDVCIILVQLASVIAYLHANDIIHRDIKTSNIFLEENGLLKLGDLGMCRHLVQPTERPKTTAGTLNYMSPEVTRERSYSKPTDIWGLGCLMFEVCALRPAFQGFNSQSLIGKIRSGRAPLVPKHYSQPLRDLLRAMLFQDERRRPTAAEILASACLQEACGKVDALFGTCYGGAAHGPTYSLAAVDPPLLTLMARFRSESGAHMQIPEQLLMETGACEPTVLDECTKQPESGHHARSAPGNVLGDSGSVTVWECDHDSMPGTCGSSVGRLGPVRHASGNSDGGQHVSCPLTSSHTSDQAVRSRLQSMAGMYGGPGKAVPRPQSARFRQVIGNGDPGSATRLRAAARKARA